MPTAQYLTASTGHPSSQSSVLLGQWATIKLALHGLFSEKLIIRQRHFQQF